ncbi:MAG: aminodeoxychorismate/anthranilate synthase component II, partial [Selenomonadaceae bacterium]|nr:aminodeoxychorismate/anthranilate synthase component II [Selenomonadaceae bacterium]
SAVIISPGPGVPSDAGISEQIISELKGVLPIFGICLGHQAIGEVFGGKVIRAKEIVHGKMSKLKHNGRGIYRGLEQGVEVGRYHSLIIERETLPDCLEVTSELDDGTIMGVRHKNFDVEGIQFHPESILTPSGRIMMENFLQTISSASCG